MRIATSMISQSALSDLQRSQRSIFDASAQTASQNKATDLKGYGRDAETLVSSQRLLARVEAQRAAGVELQTRLEVQDIALSRAGDAITQLKQALLEGVALDNGDAIESELQQAFATIKDMFNMKHGGQYIFGGTLNDREPVIADTLADLAANPLANAFEQDAEAQEVALDDYRNVKAGPIAADAANDIFDVIRNLKIFHDGVNGPFSGDITDAQSAALTTEISRLDDIYADLISVQGENGRVLKEAEMSVDRQTASANALEQTVLGITDVDLAEVAVRLNQAELSYQASASVFNTLRGLSLLDVL